MVAAITNSVSTSMAPAELETYRQKAIDRNLTLDEFLSKEATLGIDMLDIKVFTTGTVNLHAKALYTTSPTLTTYPVVIPDRYTHIRAVGLAKELGITRSDVIRLALQLAQR